MKNSHTALLAWMVAIVMFCAGALLTAMFLQEDPEEVYQAVLHFSNSSHRDVDVTVYVLGNDGFATKTISIDADNEVTLNIQWCTVDTATVFIHTTADDIDDWMVLMVEAGQWQAIILW